MLPRLRLIAAIALLLPVLAYGLSQVIARALQEDPARREPCPPAQISIRATRTNFAPGLIEHQSWVEFPVPQTFAGYFAFCLDGRLLEFGGGELDFHTGSARFNVSTTWINLQWVMGALNDYRDGNRWELRLFPVGPSG